MVTTGGESTWAASHPLRDKDEIFQLWFEGPSLKMISRVITQWARRRKQREMYSVRPSEQLYLMDVELFIQQPTGLWMSVALYFYKRTGMFFPSFGAVGFTDTFVFNIYSSWLGYDSRICIWHSDVLKASSRFCLLILSMGRVSLPL